MSYDVALFQWEDGRRRLEEAPPAERRLLEEISHRVLAELRRRLGGRFTTAELADLYSRGTDWCLELAHGAAADHSLPPDTQAAADAAFARYVREAADYAGGRRLG